MTFIYPAIFKQQDDGSFSAYFPDLECCYASGNDLEDCIDAANDACRDWIELELSEDDAVLPSVTTEDDIELKPGEFVRHISVNIKFYVGWDE